jgi:amino acid transporter
LLTVVVLAQMFCLTASVTSASRMMYAFSRDRAVPGHQLWRRISSQRVPIFAVAAIGVLSWALMIPTLWNAVVGYLVGTSIAVIGLYIAFGIPVYLRWRAGDAFERGAWHLGERYKWIDLLAIGWIALICILFMLPIAPGGVPWDDAFDWNVVNYAPLTVGGAFLLFGGWWVLSAKRWFKGPVRQGTDEELERIEEELESATRLRPEPAA